MDHRLHIRVPVAGANESVPSQVARQRADAMREMRRVICDILADLKKAGIHPAGYAFLRNIFDLYERWLPVYGGAVATAPHGRAVIQSDGLPTSRDGFPSKAMDGARSPVKANASGAGMSRSLSRSSGQKRRSI